MLYKIYTDGATSNNGSKAAAGGWAFIILDEKGILCKNSAHIPCATNNICELRAIQMGCQTIFSKLEPFDVVEVYSDSAYCINCVNDKWYRKWQQNGWITSSKKPVANQEYWEQLIPFFEDPRFKWIKVKGHNGDIYNEMVDKMAVIAKSENPLIMYSGSVYDVDFEPR